MKRYIKEETRFNGTEHCSICKADLSITPYIKCDCGLKYCIKCLVNVTLDFSQCPECYYVFTLDKLDYEFGEEFQDLAFKARVQHYFTKTIESDKCLMSQAKDSYYHEVSYQVADEYVEQLFRKFYVKIQSLDCPSIDSLVEYVRECYSYYTKAKELLKRNISERLNKLYDYINGKISSDEFKQFINVSIKIYWNLLYTLDIMFEIISWVHCYLYSAKTSLIRKYRTLGLSDITYLTKDYTEIVDKIYSYCDMISCLNEHYQLGFPYYQCVY